MGCDGGILMPCERAEGTSALLVLDGFWVGG